MLFKARNLLFTPRL